MPRLLHSALLAFLLVVSAPAQAATNWYADAVWYQIFPERFRNGDPRNDPTRESLAGTWPYSSPTNWQVSPWTSDWYELQPWEKDGKGFYHHAQLRRYGGDLQGILDRLDHLQQLGVNALYLNPVFDSPSSHKYGATAYHHIDRHFGPDPVGDARIMAEEDPANPATWKWTSADRLFLKLLDEAHRRKMRVVIDGVFNHVGIPFWALQRAKREGPGSRFAAWFQIKRWDDPATPRDEFDYQGWVGIKDLPQFNRDETNLHADVRAHLHAVVRRWMDPNGDGNPADGIDGWRLDVAAEVPMGFWREFRGWVKAINPDAYLTGEIWWENFDQFTFRNARPWLDGAFDGVMNYRLGDAIYQFLNEPNGISAQAFIERTAALQRDVGFDSWLDLQNIFATHDTSRIGSAVVNPRLRQDHGAGVQDHRDYLVRAPHAAEKQRWKQMVTLQFLLPGAPYLYYGDEAGMWGADDPDCRKPMVWPDLTYATETAHPFGAERPADPVRFDEEMFRFYREWIALRHRLPVLRRGSFEPISTNAEPRVLLFVRRLGDSQVRAAFNSGTEEARLTWPMIGLPAGTKDLSGETQPEEFATIPAHGYRVWVSP